MQHSCICSLTLLLHLTQSNPPLSCGSQPKTGSGSADSCLNGPVCTLGHVLSLQDILSCPVKTMCVPAKVEKVQTCPNKRTLSVCDSLVVTHNQNCAILCQTLQPDVISNYPPDCLQCFGMFCGRSCNYKRCVTAHRPLIQYLPA